MIPSLHTIWFVVFELVNGIENFPLRGRWFIPVFCCTLIVSSVALTSLCLGFISRSGVHRSVAPTFWSLHVRRLEAAVYILISVHFDARYASIFLKHGTTAPFPRIPLVFVWELLLYAAASSERSSLAVFPLL